MRRSFAFAVCITGLLATADCQYVAGIAGDVVLATDDGGVASCSDHTRNGAETDVDCGGGACPACDVGEGCLVGPDCTSKVCAGNTCAAPTCTDLQPNGEETGTDCGGGLCPPCPAGSPCAVSADCKGGSCDNGVCSPTCADQAKNGAESDVDCGGSCPACAIDQACNTGADCVTGICDGASQTCATSFIWAKSFGDAAANQAAKAVAVDASGNVYVAGRTAGTINFGNGPKTAVGIIAPFLAKLGPNGNALWSNVYANGGATDKGEIVSVAPGPNGTVVFGGGFSGSLTVPPTTLIMGGFFFSTAGVFDGTSAWAKGLGAGSNSLSSVVNNVVVDTNGDFLVAGEFNGTINFEDATFTGAGNSNDVFLLKRNNQGVSIFSKHFGTMTGGAGDLFVATDASRNILLACDGGTLNFGGATLSGTGGNLAIAKLGPDGVHAWSRIIGDNGTQRPSGVAVDLVGNLIVAGKFSGQQVDFGGTILNGVGGVGFDIFVAKFDPNGALVWAKSYGTMSTEFATSVAVDPTGNVLVTGLFGEALDFGGGTVTPGDSADIFVLKLDPNGNHVWSESYGGDGQPQGFLGLAIAAAGPNTIVLAGDYLGQLDFGGAPADVLNSIGQSDIFVAKLRVP